MIEINATDYDKTILSGKVVVDFFSTECPPCEALAPKLDSLAALYGNDIRFVKVFRQGNRELADKLAVKSSPTLLFYENGKEVQSRVSGGIKKSEIIERLNGMMDAEKLKAIQDKIKPSVTECDVLIIGGGPAGLTAGLYLCQAKVNTIMIDTQLPGGYVAITHQVSNYPGFIDPQPGYMLSHNMSEQTKLCGVVFKVAVDVTMVDLVKKEVVIDEYETIKANKIIIGTGSSPNYLNVPGEKELKGKGISYCATCDAKYYVDKDVIVIGGGNSAVEEADFITKFAASVTLVHQFDKLQANAQAQEKLLANPKVKFLFSHEVRGFYKEGDRLKLVVEDLKTKTNKDLITDGAFVFVGLKPNLDMFDSSLNKDQWGYLITDEDKRTNLEDIYAIGDVTSKKYRQITTAVADGTIAAIAITRELNK